MSQEEFIKLARGAGFVAGVCEDVPFAKLCHPTPTSASLYRMLESLINRAAAHEREACAKLCEDIDTEYEGEDVLATWCATAIRARGEQ